MTSIMRSPFEVFALLHYILDFFPNYMLQYMHKHTNDVVRNL